MKAKTLLAFALSVAGCTLAASYRFYDSAHTIGLIHADGGKARHPILLDKGRDSYTLIATATVLPPYRGNVRVVIEGTPAMDYVIYPSEPAVDLSPYRHPAFRDNVLYDLQPQDKVALWVVMKPRRGGPGAIAPPVGKPPKQNESRDLSTDSSSSGPIGVAHSRGGNSGGDSSERPGGGWGGRGRKSGPPRGGGTAQRLAFYDTVTGKEVLSVPIIYTTKGAGGEEHESQ